MAETILQLLAGNSKNTDPNRPAMALLPLSPRDQSINGQDQDGSQDRTDEPRRLALSIPTEVLPDIGGYEGADDTKQDRDDESTRICSRHEQLGNEPDQKTDNDDP
jgi:hypothetical protein